MTPIRRNSSSVEPEEPQPKRKYADFQGLLQDEPDVTSGKERPKIDSNTGQAGAFPGLADEDEMFYGPANNGVDYIRMVMSERKGIPHLLSSNSVQYDGNMNDGSYYDGAYSAAPVDRESIGSSFGLAQQYHYDSLLTQFRLIQAAMRCVPPFEEIRKLDATKPISFPPQSKQARKRWESHLSECSPHPVQVVCIEWESIQQLIQLMTRKLHWFFKFNDARSIQCVGAWVWAILGRVPDRGELDGEEIANLRAFARRAIEVSKSYHSKSLSNLEAFEDTSDGSSEDESGPGLSEARSSNNAAIERPETSTTFNALDNNKWESVNVIGRKLLVLDVVVTVIGELYGQRDLLDLRIPWSADSDMK